MGANESYVDGVTDHPFSVRLGIVGKNKEVPGRPRVLHVVTVHKPLRKE